MWLLSERFLSPPGEFDVIDEPLLSSWYQATVDTPPAGDVVVQQDARVRERENVIGFCSQFAVGSLNTTPPLHGMHTKRCGVPALPSDCHNFPMFPFA